jgi:CHASE3 domain sensor protein
MSWFHDLPLRRKLIACFLAVAVLTLAVGGAGFSVIGKIVKSSQEISGKQLPSMLGLNDLNAGVSNMRRLELGMLLAKTANDEPRFRRQVEEFRTSMTPQVEQGRATYEAPGDARGADASLAKPFTPGALARAVRDVLDTAGR